MSSIEIYHAQAERLGRHLSKKYNLDLNQPQLLNAIAIAVLGERDWNHAVAALKTQPQQSEMPSKNLSQPELTGEDFCYFVPEKPESDGLYTIWRVFHNNPTRRADAWAHKSRERTELLKVAQRANSEIGWTDADVQEIVEAHLRALSGLSFDNSAAPAPTEAKQKDLCYWVSDMPEEDGKFYVSIVKRDAPVYNELHGGYPDRQEALKVAQLKNGELGLTEAEVKEIVESSIRASIRQNGLR